MLDLLNPLKSESLVDVFTRRIEELILSGRISIGQKLPAERELAQQLCISRPVVHEGLIELESRGLITMKPRSGCIVNDYRRSGSLALLRSLVNFSHGTPSPEILDGMLKMRMLFETETAGLAALIRTEKNLSELKALVAEEKNTDRRDSEKIIRLDFNFHLLVAISSGNMVYPLMLNSFRDVYTNLTRIFFKDRTAVDFVFGRHSAFVSALEKSNKKLCVKIMNEIIEHGETHLRKMISSEKN